MAYWNYRAMNLNSSSTFPSIFPAPPLSISSINIIFRSAEKNKLQEYRITGIPKYKLQKYIIQITEIQNSEIQKYKLQKLQKYKSKDYKNTSSTKVHL